MHTTIPLIVFAYLTLHLAWLPFFCWQHMATTMLGGVAAYLFVIGWFAVLHVCFWYAVRHVLPRCWRTVGTLVALPLYFYLLANHSTPFCKGVRGYPLANPLLPIARLLVSQQAVPVGEWSCVLLGDCGRPTYVYPLLPNTGHNQLSRAQRAQRVYQQVSEVPDPPKGRGVVVSPESFFPYEIAESELARWRSALPDGVEWWFGTMMAAKNGGYSHQIIEKISHNNQKSSLNPIRQPYVKQLCIDLFEECDESPRFHRIGKSLFGKSIGGVVAGEGGVGSFAGVRLLICAELFWPPTSKQGASIVFANETWFPAWVQWLMQSGAAWRALIDNEQVLWVGQRNCVLYRPFQLFTFGRS